MTTSTPPLPAAIETALAQLPVPMVVGRLPSGSLLRTNPAWDALFGDRPMEEIVPADELGNVRTLLQLIADHQLEGFLRRGRLVAADGREVEGLTALRRLSMMDTLGLAVMIFTPAEQEDAEPSAWTELVAGMADLAILVTDHDWRIHGASSDVKARLGYDPRSIIGTPLLGLVHPQDALKLLRAIDGAVASKHATIAHVRLRTADGSWRELLLFITTLCEDDPPLLAVLLFGPDSAPAASESTRAKELEQHLWRIAMEVRAAGLVRDMGNTLSASRPRQSPELSGRQWEIVTRLVNGQRVPEIARSMYLSQSTVRNHLTAVFRKFDVHSQQELVSLLTGAARPPA